MSLLVSHGRRSPEAAFWLVPGLVMAITGMAGVWRLPYLAATHGGGAFLLAYAVMVIVMGGPLLAGQLLLARGQDRDLSRVLALWCPGRASRLMQGLGLVWLVAIGLLLAVYGVIGSWVLAYTARAIGGVFVDTDRVSAARDFAAFASDGERGLGWLLFFWIALVLPATRKVRRGVLQALGFSAIVAGVLLLVLLVRAPDLQIERWRTLFVLGPLDAQDLFVAGYQALYALGLGSGVLLCLGQALPGDAPVFRRAGGVTVMVLLIGLGACALWPMLFDDLQLVSLANISAVLVQAPLVITDRLALAAFFALLAILAISSGLALFETLIQALAQNAGLRRPRAVLSMSGVLLIGGLFIQHDLVATAAAGAASHDVVGRITGWVGDFVFPLAALGVAVLLGIGVTPARLGPSERGDRGLRVWQFLVRYPARLLLLVVVLYALGVTRWAFMFWSTP